MTVSSSTLAAWWRHFNPHLLCRRWRESLEDRIINLEISIHTFFAEGDLAHTAKTYTDYLFQSTPSLQKVTWWLDGTQAKNQISIHTFFAEGDPVCRTRFLFFRNFNPHLLCRRWPATAEEIKADREFQSTPSLQKVTVIILVPCHRLIFQSTPSLQKVTWYTRVKRSMIIFQSTPSLQKVTPLAKANNYIAKISIHTFFAEGDLLHYLVLQGHFQFQSTPSLQKVTDLIGYNQDGSWISIHTFFAEGDKRLDHKHRVQSNFNPHLLCRRWQTWSARFRTP